ncbi:FecCD family ABC transporter permease [Streptococcus hillyeri]|uniref:Iron ABC transporter permease n=1 Tax=Streptococcus hillyeri TaxID=2282420 RepID=A0A3L9DUU7_9STRE|nr:iron ABC transporter permease [Streptococcus hillyeri]RLY04124.1 iron ABC transporter permease [Streptococcus hillyeri]
MNQTTTHFKRIFILLILVTLFLALLSLSLGSSHLSLVTVIKTLLGQTDDKTRLIILTIRLPRILAALIAGASLAISGLLLQTLTRNPLADSGILGINAGAGLIIALAISIFKTTAPQFITLLPLMAMLGALTTVMIVYFISRKPNHDIDPIRLIITGVGLSIMLSGLMVSIIGNIDRFKVDYIINWLSGQISGDNWKTLALLSPFLILLLGLSYSRSRSLNIMTLNEQTATALGLNLQKERLITLLLSTALASLSVIIVGNITFIGLISGHISRRFVGGNHLILFPITFLMGMLILLIADTIGRVFLVGTGIPTGLVVSLIGAPYFLYLMKTSKE